MTGRSGKRKAEASSTGNHPAAPTARRSRRGAAPAPPAHELEAPAARTARLPSPGHTMETMHLNIAHRLRSGREVFVPNTEKPGPMQFKKGERAVPDLSWLTPTCAKVALEHYNRLNEEDEHKLVKAIDSIVFFFNGPWYHANFLAKSKGASNCVDQLVPKYFFAELRIVPEGKGKTQMLCLSCIKMDRGNPQTKRVRGCKTCPTKIFHPAGWSSAASSR